MASYDDDLAPFENEPVIRALTGPASPEELAGEQAALEGFRRSGKPSPSRRFAVRVGTSSGLAVAALGLSGGVAAAYSNVLPRPIQQAVSDVLHPIGVPKPPKVHHVAGGGRQSGGGSSRSTTGGGGGLSFVAPAAPSGSPSATASPAGSPTARATGAHAEPSASPSPSPAVTGTPQVTPSAPPSVTPSQTATPTPPPPAPAALSISVSDTRVQTGSTVQVVGAVTDATGQPVGEHRVAAFEHLAGTSGWQPVGVGQTTDDGSVQFTTPALTQDTAFVLRAGGGVHSARVRVVVVPEMSVGVTQGSGTDQVSVSTQGAQPGDRARVFRRAAGGWKLVQVVSLDSTGSASFALTPAPHRTISYRIVLLATGEHAATAASFITPAG